MKLPIIKKKGAFSFWQQAWLFTFLFHLTFFIFLSKGKTVPMNRIPNQNYRYVNLARLPVPSSSKLVVKTKNIQNKTAQVPAIQAPLKTNNEKLPKISKVIGEQRKVTKKITTKGNNQLLIGNQPQNQAVKTEIQTSDLKMIKSESAFETTQQITMQTEFDRHSGHEASLVNLEQQEGLFSYEQQIIQMIMRHWVKPLSLSPKDFCTWKVYLSLQGEVQKIVLVASSGNESLNVSSSEAIYAAQPFSLPSDQKAALAFLELKITFREDY